jgi:hypothetical protein
MSLYDRLFGQLDGWLTFTPVAWVKTNAAPRLHADGPSPSVESIYVARRRGAWVKAVQRHRPGHYITTQARGSPLVGSKPLALMEQIIQDYSEPGWLVVDPFCGTGTTIVACAMYGRRAVGCEVNEATHRYASERLAKAQAEVAP